MNNFLLQTLMNNLKNKNPKGYETINTFMRNNGNPQDVIKQIMSNVTPEQKENLLNQAKSYRLPR